MFGGSGTDREPSQRRAPLNFKNEGFVGFIELSVNPALHFLSSSTAEIGYFSITPNDAVS